MAAAAVLIVPLGHDGAITARLHAAPSRLIVRYDFSYRGTYKCTSTEKKKNLGKSGRENPSGRYVFEMHREC